MIDLLALPALRLEAGAHPMLGVAGLRLLTPQGAPVAEIRERVGAARAVRRFFSASPGSAPADLEVLTPDGATVLVIGKGDQSLARGTSVSVRLADGTPVGATRGRLGGGLVSGMSGGRQLALSGPDGGALGTYTFHDAVRAEVADPTGTVLARVERHLTTRGGALAAGVARAYDLSFAEAAPVALRALTLAVAVAADTRLQ